MTNIFIGIFIGILIEFFAIWFIIEYIRRKVKVKKNTMIVISNSPDEYTDTLCEQGCYEAVFLETCPECDRYTLLIYGVFSNGEIELPTGHKPIHGELVRNYNSVCQFCGYNQHS